MALMAGEDGFPGWDGMGSSAGNGAGISAE